MSKRKTPLPDVLDSIRNFDKFPDSYMVRMATVCAILGISEATGWRWQKSGLLPPGHKIGPRIRTWTCGEVRKKQRGETAD